jgi:hypothetical protein
MAEKIHPFSSIFCPVQNKGNSYGLIIVMTVVFRARFALDMVQPVRKNKLSAPANSENRLPMMPEPRVRKKSGH